MKRTQLQILSKRQGVYRGVPFDLLKRLSPGRQEFMRKIFDNPRHYVLLSSRQLSHQLKCDSATVIRTASAMGFKSYRDFQYYLHELCVARVTPLKLMRDSASVQCKLPKYAQESLGRDSDNLKILRESIDFGQILILVKKLYAARRIIVVGGDQASTLADFLAYTLAMIGLPATSLVSAGQVAHTIRNTNKRDVIIGITFGRGLRLTADGLSQGRRNGAYCVGISDTMLSPIAPLSRQFFTTSIQSPSFAGSYVGPSALLNIVLVTCAHYRKLRTIGQLKKAEEEQTSGFRWCPR